MPHVFDTIFNLLLNYLLPVPQQRMGLLTSCIYTSLH
jgi:hypothetical protein